MAFLDFLKDRAVRQQPDADKSQTPKPEMAKQMYTREAAQERANQKPLTLEPRQQTELDAVRARLEKATQHLGPDSTPPPSPIPADSSGSRESMRQNMTAQDKEAPALSPTSGQAGKTAIDKAPENSPEPAKPAPTKPPTLPRRPPSWER
jgi:hypothetical protein